MGARPWHWERVAQFRKASPDATRLGPRALNRALLARQALLARVTRRVPAAVEQLIGLQAQNTASPYVALWSRLDGFRVEDLSRLLRTRRAVRLALFRSTVHLVTARDALVLRPVVQPAIERALAASQYGRRLRRIDPRALAEAGRALLQREPRTTSELGELLAPRFPDADADAIGYALRAHLALVQVPPRGIWGEGGPPRCAALEAWLDRPLGRESSQEPLLLRYLAACGPATAADFQAWSGVQGGRALVEAARPRLRVFVDERGRELYDLPRAPLPEPDTPAPVRFLPEYDNAFIAHADRERIVAPADLARMRAANGFLSPFLADGFVAGTWKVAVEKARATLTLRPMRKLVPAVRVELEDEGARLLAFIAPDAKDADVRFAR
jgi:hypothetical protein